MAQTLTFEFARFNDGEVIIEYDIRDNNWSVTQIRCINNSDFDAVGRVYLIGELVFEAVGSANQTTSWNTQGIDLDWQPDYWNDITQTWEPSGIDMGDYVFQSSWPVNG